MERNMCANCGHWREEHYTPSSVFIGDRLFGCTDYQGTIPTREQLERREEDLRRAQEARYQGKGREVEDV